ncbi:polyprenyl synthetase family protein [Nocardia sp. NRRL S-836]|uniref:polyprenyl synthetase family protein n=1 Tax=Nocardia sp. NRRL S-836 TaxID=1519492 RepID=UPI0006AE3CD8|nr:polyprenyl synthetase family protein [Nocardia sp. NRRL S-836]KOV80696.1 hypothetical protein ADL03_31885 [Nocardia sp. NRRL S-836]
MTSTDVVVAPQPAQDVPAWCREVVEPPLRAAVATLPRETREVVDHHLTGQDFVVSALALLAAETVGAAGRALKVAVALELAHLHEQLHADLTTRAVSRGRQPSAWVEFGDERATSAAEALLSLAFAHVSKAEVRTLNAALLSVVDGYVREIELTDGATEVAEHLGVAAAKHAALPACACELGALAAGATSTQARHLRSFGEHVGLASKHVDDVLALWGGPMLSGRPLYDDLAHARRTLPVVAALDAGADLTGSPAEQARAIEQAGGRRWCEQQADLLLARALDHLRQVGASGPAAEELAQLARAVTVERCAPVRSAARGLVPGSVFRTGHGSVRPVTQAVPVQPTVGQVPS